MGWSLFAAALGCLLLQGLLVPSLAINWDEFRFLSDVHLLARGELESAVQTFHSHFFGWLLWLPGQEVHQIIAARTVMLVMQAGIAGMIYRCARRFAGVQASLFAVLSYLSLFYVVRHGASFRFDTPSTFLLMAATTFLLTSRIRLWTTLAVGALVAVAALVTIKSIFYVPTLAVIAWWRLQTATEPRRMLIRLLSGALFGAAMLALLYVYHQSHTVAGSLGAAQGMVSSSVNKTIGESHLMPRRYFFIRSLLQSPMNWLILAGSVAFAAVRLVRAPSAERPAALVILALAAPLGTLLFYRNAYPYYFVFMLAPVAVVVAVLAEKVRPRIVLALVGWVLLAIAAVQAHRAVTPTLAVQRRIVEAVHATFPRHLSYIDCCSMIASSPKQGFFMSTWGAEAYRAEGKPIMREILATKRPAYLLVDHPLMAQALAAPGARPGPGLIAEDNAVLRDNYIPHWGPVWVAGKQVEASPQPTVWNALVAADYTLEARSPVSIDGVERAPGSLLTLRAGPHTIAAAEPQTVILRWGDHLARPKAPPPRGPVFDPF